ncbi:hypothetical protein [Paenibacillus eucommiae]|uniref:Uncharacterized protein n=1 Tax=Paenibacillus eucommiae TaxID=1355755 RepID=A0ABS4IU92_9BACL|nr:hypothetical protein [Paenibacillus eucommiae]MBP1991078.1 hypothetical protein [Paenibacillus eucommiae]
MMNIPTEKELAFLFEGDQLQLNAFILEHNAHLASNGLEEDDLAELADDSLEEQIRQIFDYVYGVVVDWREYDDQIVSQFGERIPEEVEVECTDEGLTVTYDHTVYPVKLSFSPKDRYITIRAFKEIIKDKYEMRLFEYSYLSDTHDFLLLPNETWVKLEEKYGSKVADIFRVIDDKLDFP